MLSEIAAAQLLEASAASSEAWQALAAKRHWSAQAEAEIRGQSVSDLKKLEVPADTAADLGDLIRLVVKVDALSIERADAFARKAADFDTVALRDRRAQSRMIDALDRILLTLSTARQPFRVSVTAAHFAVPLVGDVARVERRPGQAGDVVAEIDGPAGGMVGASP